MEGSFVVDLLLSLSPAILAIGLALLTKKVVPSLAAGAFAGAIVSMDWSILDALEAYLGYLLDAFIPNLSSMGVSLDQSGTLLGGWLMPPTEALDWSHLIITAFSLLVAATVAVLGRSGATRAVVGLVERVAKGPSGAMLSSWLAGCIVFFDDYANCLVVGNAMGPVCDRFRVSRAKLAYIVDSTAAPIASLAIVSTWVGTEVSIIHDQLIRAGSDANAFSVFLSAIPYRFYGIFTLIFVGLIAWSGRDYGPMLEVEREARRAPEQALKESKSSTPTGNPWVAILPVVTLVGLTFGWMLWGGARSIYVDQYELAVDAGSSAVVAQGQAWAALGQTSLFDLIGAADPFSSMLIAAIVAFLMACSLATLTRTASVRDLPGFAWAGSKPVCGALGILFMAWSLGSAIEATGADGNLKALIETEAVFVVGDEGDEGLALNWSPEVGISSAWLEITDSQGSLVRTQAIGSDQLASATVRWDGALDDGGDAPAGTYSATAWQMEEGGEKSSVATSGPPWFPGWLLPSVVFLLAGATAFATGTSYGTMGILLPLAIPIAVGIEGGDPGAILLGSTAAVLAGACLGDHASPISDTTVLSALGSGVELLTHVRTQLPYALTTGAISLAVGYIPAGLGVSPWLLLPIGAAACVGAVYLLGRPVEEEKAQRKVA